MYSREAGVTSVGDGEIFRGWDAMETADVSAEFGFAQECVQMGGH
jgi:hypothetical protein